MTIELDFRGIDKTVKNSTPRNSSLCIYQRNVEILYGVHQRAADSLQRLYIISFSFVTTRPLKCNDRVINGLFHTKRSKCLDVHASEKIIIL